MIYTFTIARTEISSQLIRTGFETLSSCVNFAISYRGVEQLVARRAHNPKVTGSSPVPATKNPSKAIADEGFSFLCQAVVGEHLSSWSPRWFFFIAFLPVI
jgi:hypothetical protein